LAPPAPINRARPRDGSITAGDLVGKLEYLTLRCDKCGRAGRYRVLRLVEEIGPDGKLTDWQRITADCPRRWVLHRWSKRISVR
jgi:hypothetical protein